MIKIGLTGSIAVGKSFVLSIFKTEYNVPVFSSDECVRGIYRHNVDLNNFIKDEILKAIMSLVTKISRILCLKIV